MIVIALGNKARQGKDYAVNYMKESFENAGGKAFVLHWAEALYNECSNNARRKPLIEKKIKSGKEVYYLLTSDIPEIYFPEQVPEIKSFMNSRSLVVYEGMDAKDSLLLQAWGTGIRRRYFGEDYWIRKTLINLSYLRKSYPTSLILFPDTRFLNEYNVVKKELSGFYVKIVRLNKNSTRFIAQDRDSSHQSETELDNAIPDFTIEVMDGDFDGLKERSREVLNSILQLQEVYND